MPQRSPQKKSPERDDGPLPPLRPGPSANEPRIWESRTRRSTTARRPVRALTGIPETQDRAWNGAGSASFAAGRAGSVAGGRRHRPFRSLLEPAPNPHRDHPFHTIFPKTVEPTVGEPSDSASVGDHRERPTALPSGDEPP